MLAYAQRRGCTSTLFVHIIGYIIPESHNMGTKCEYFILNFIAIDNNFTYSPKGYFLIVSFTCYYFYLDKFDLLLTRGFK